MRRVSQNAYTELYFWGCNPSFVATGDGVVMIDAPQQPIDCMRWRDRMVEHGPIRHLINTEPHGDHIRGNAYFPRRRSHRPAQATAPLSGSNPADDLTRAA
jgi:glyoxylase-like metal-dependent hydrolase (beta-lactamase superfamily II)